MILSLFAHALALERVEVCHQEGAKAAPVEVSERAVAAHVAHGDHVVADEVCGNEIDDDCDGEVDEGCACPCYAAEDLDRLHALWSSWQVHEDYGYAYYTCDERFTTHTYANGGTFDSDTVELYFYGYSVDLEPDGSFGHVIGGEGAFYGVSYDWDYPWASGSERYCSAYATGYETGDPYDWWDEPSFEYLTETEVEACQALVLDWAAAAGLTCETTVEHLGP